MSKNRILYGYPLSAWEDAAREHFGHPPSMDEVAEYIQLYQNNVSRTQHLASSPFDMDQIEEANRDELQFQRMLREKFPHLVGMYMEFMENLSS